MWIKIKIFTCGFIFGIIVLSGVKAMAESEDYTLQISKYHILVNDVEYKDDKLPALQMNEEVYIPLQRFCNITGINFNCNKQFKQIELRNVNNNGYNMNNNINNNMRMNNGINYIDSSKLVSKDVLANDKKALEIIEKTGNINNIMIYIPHMSKSKVDTIVKNYIGETDDFNCIYAIRQYLSIECIDDIVKSYIDRTGDYGTVAAILQFMSEDASDYVSKKYINESKDQQYSEFFIPYLKN
ncbi:hypothetical protein [Tepidibacter mesophilus]|uniref:hypothetical protein n=1 Tax=Tepidibacter mesophilus TaxID=655607 RepID=UPI000C084AFD|nr:hypothetical protein [Tepidibacter mesophilus]